MSGSMRESLKALNAAFSASTVPDPLPDELYATIDAFLQRYDDIDDHDSQRFHDDLHALYLRHVANSPDKRGAFLSALRLLRPAITGEARLTAWWNSALRPVIDGIGYKKSEIEDARAFVQSILVYDPGEDHDGEHARLSALFTNKILDAYLARTKVPSDAVSPENEFIAHELEAVLVAFGRKMPKILLLTLDDLLVQKQHRIQALNLLSAFVRLQPPHLHLVLETPLVQNLEKCLLIDNSSTVIELALVVLIMFLPHICGALTSDHHLEKMFLVYCRILCWDKLGNNDGKAGEMDMHDDDDDDDDSEEEDEENHDSSEQAWEQVQPSMDYPASPPPTLMHYFTFLYGLFPLNFMSFVRKPRRYLKSLNFPGARDFDLDQDLIHSRTEPYRRVHLLHPNMFTTTVEDELSENRWLKSDPADVVVECMDLCVAVSSTLEDPGPPPNAALPPVPEIPSQFTLDDQDGTTVHDSDESWRNTQSTMNVSGDAPQIPDFEVPRSKSIKSAVSIKSMASPLLKGRDMMDSPTLPPTTDTKKPDMASPLAQRFVAQQPSLDSFAQSISGQTSGQSDFQNHTMASLQREIMLLRNDLNFERYLKLQHLAHIGQLQRKHIKEATAEAETQNLINTNKTLKAKLAKANELYAQLKKETLTSRSQSKKWESELNNKVRSYKESEKTWHSDEGGLRYELQRTQSDYEQLKKIVERAEAEQLKAQQRTKALEYELEDYSDIRRELESAQDKIIAFEDQRKELHTLIQERNDLRNDLEIANMRLNSREQDRERSIKAYERRIMELESRLQTSDRSTGIPGQLPSSVQQMLDSTLAASNAKMQQLKKTHYRLLEQYTELQMKYHDLEGEREAEMGQLYPRDKAGHVDFGTSRMSRNSSVRTANNYSSRYLTPLSTTEVPPNEEQEYYEYRSPESVHSPGAGPSPLRPARLESLQHGKPQRSQTAPSPYPGFGGNYGPDFSAAYDASLHNQFQAPKPPQSSGQSSFSADTDGSSNKDRKEKVEPKSEVRIYGRGGAQNIGKKVKEKEQKKPSSSKTGGFRGLKGIM